MKHETRMEEDERLTDKVPSKWITIVVKYGEKGKHLYADTDFSTGFWATEAEAQMWAEGHCRYDQKAIVAVLKVDRLVKAKPVEFETVAA